MDLTGKSVRNCLKSENHFNFGCDLTRKQKLIGLSDICISLHRNVEKRPLKMIQIHNKLYLIRPIKVFETYTSHS